MIDENNNHNNYLKEIPVCKIFSKTSKTRAEDTYDEIEELGQSIKQVGMINPVYVRKKDTGYELIVGQRRFKAAQSAGIATIPCIVVDIKDEEALILSITENIQRRNLNYFEQAHAISTLMNLTGMTQTDVANKLSRKQSTIANKLRLMNIPDILQDYLIENGIKERQARALLRLENESDIIKAAHYCVKNKLNVAKFDSYINKQANNNMHKTKPFFKGLCRDIRLYVNSLNHTYNLMKNSGIDTEMEKNEDNEKIVYKIVINK